METKATHRTDRHRRIRRLVGAGTLVLVTTGVLAACSSDDSDDSAAAVTTSTVAAAAEDTATTVAGVDNVGSGTDGGQAGGSGGGQSGGGQSGGGSGNGGTAAPAPVIGSFSTPESIDCHNDNFQMFTASWTTTNAVRVTISIDGPGVYEEYPANGEASLPFNCSTEHSFLLTAYGSDGQTATRSVTLQPRNVQNETEEEL